MYETPVPEVNFKLIRATPGRNIKGRVAPVGSTAVKREKNQSAKVCWTRGQSGYLIRESYDCGGKGHLVRNLK